MRIIKLIVQHFRGVGGSKAGKTVETVTGDDLFFQPIEVDLSQNLIFLIGRNNAGKSSFLFAYDKFVKSKAKMSISDFHKKDTSSPIIMEAWLKAETDDEMNDAQTGKWFSKIDGVAKLRKVWKGVDIEAERCAFDPNTNVWVDNGFGGLETIAQNRCPEPKWISGFMAPEELIKSVKEIVKEALLVKISDCDEYKEAIKSVEVLQNVIMGSEAKTQIEGHLNKHISQVFPDIEFRVITPPSNDLSSLFEKNADVAVVEQGRPELPMGNHGHGVRRQFLLSALEGVAELLKGSNKKKSKSTEPAKGSRKVDDKDAELSSSYEVSGIKTKMLLFEEPELFLHPHAMRMIQGLIYSLAESSPFQIMAATHSPVLVDLSRPHQTLVRVTNDSASGTLVRQVSSNLFSNDERQMLMMLNKFNPHVCEAFFANQVLLVEGDTEAVVVRSILAKMRELDLIEPSNDLHVVNCGSKTNIPLFQKVLRHFYIPYFVFHDLDTILDKNGDGNSAWGMNQSIWDEIDQAGKAGIMARRFVFNENFESAHGYKHNSSKGKMYSAYQKAENWSVLDLSIPVVFHVSTILGVAHDSVVYDMVYLESIASVTSGSA